MSEERRRLINYRAKEYRDIVSELEKKELEIIKMKRNIDGLKESKDIIARELKKLSILQNEEDYSESHWLVVLLDNLD